MRVLVITLFLILALVAAAHAPTGGWTSLDIAAAPVGYWHLVITVKTTNLACTTEEEWRWSNERR